MDKRKALGRGLEALIPSSKAQAPQLIENIEITQIRPNRYQPRVEFDPQLMEELKSSVEEKGLIQPILVRRIEGGYYEIIAGERRWRVAEALGMRRVPAIVKEIKQEAEVLETALIENIQRQGLNPIEEARAYERLINEFGFRVEEISSVLGKNMTTVINTLRLLKLPRLVQEKLLKREITAGHGRAILSLEQEEAQMRFCEKIIREGLSVREAENRARTFKTPLKKLQRKELPGERKKDAQLLAWEEELQRILGTKVRILHRRERGNIQIEYYSLSDLERLLHLIEKIRGEE